MCWCRVLFTMLLFDKVLSTRSHVCTFGCLLLDGRLEIIVVVVLGLFAFPRISYDLDLKYFFTVVMHFKVLYAV